MEYPKTYPCPRCGSTKRWVEELFKEESEKGKTAGDIPFGMSMAQVPIMDPRKPQISAPLLIVLSDICMDCGQEYICRVDLKPSVPVMPKSAMQQGHHRPLPGQGQMPPGFLKG